MSNDQNIGESFSRFQAALRQDGSSWEEFIEQNYLGKWTGEAIYHVMAIRSSFVNAMHNYLHQNGLFNLERVSLSPVTDPLAHDIEHSPSISYKGHDYKTTHSMIYSKFLACFNPRIKGIYVDSPNIRLEIESANRVQRGKYLVDFSQMDIEVRRPNYVELESYLNEPKKVTDLLRSDMDQALNFFEGLIIAAVSAVAEQNQEDLAALGVRLQVPTSPFPRYTKDEAIALTQTKTFENPLGKQAGQQFFWITGLMRENYDLIYPYLKADGSRRSLKEFSSEEIYNYDLCAQSLQPDGSFGDGYEVLSGALREWLYEPIIERLIDNKIIKTRPVFADGQLDNLEELEGYGPFLSAAHKQDADGKRLFPSTFGGGLGIERCLFALLNGEVIKQIDDVTLFGKNPDSHPVYLF
jgi:aspartyl/asparaginyl-tRNA synthetase